MTTPSQRIIATAERTLAATDANGRRLAIRLLGALDKLRLFKAAGPDLAQNEPYLGLAMLACSVTAIDDVPLPFPSSEAQIERAVQLLGDEGLTAVAEALAEAQDGAGSLDRDSAKN